MRLPVADDFEKAEDVLEVKPLDVRAPEKREVGFHHHNQDARGLRVSRGSLETSNSMPAGWLSLLGTSYGMILCPSV